MLFQESVSKLLEASGDDVIYFGDHLPADVVECREQSNWRTCLIVPELTDMDNYAADDDLNTEDDIDALKMKLSKAVSKTSYKQRSIFRCGSGVTEFSSSMLKYSDVYTGSVCNIWEYQLDHVFHQNSTLTLPHE